MLTFYFIFPLILSLNVSLKAKEVDFQHSWARVIIALAFDLKPSLTSSNKPTDKPFTGNATHSVTSGYFAPTPTKAEGLFPYKCDKIKMTVAGWGDLGMDEYIKSYPDGAHLSLKDFAAQNGAGNFVCGLNEPCNAGQLCAPIVGRAWYVLYAAQQYNDFQQSLYNAIGIVSSMTQSVGADLVHDLFEQTHKKRGRLLHKIGNIMTIIGAVVSLVVLGALMFVPGLNAFALAAAVGAVYATSQTVVVMKAGDEEAKAEKQDPFTRWAHYAEYIADWQEKSQYAIGEELEKRFKAGVSADAGIFGVIQKGAFMKNYLEEDTYDLDKKYKRIITIRLITQMLRAKKAFVTRGSDKCNGKGPGGAFRLEDGWLSWCNREGVMFNIIYANGDQAGNHLYNAASIVNKYKLSVEYLTKQSWDCQRNNIGTWDADPYAHGQLPHDENSPCLVNLPVCDCWIPDVRRLRHTAGTVGACRSAGRIPV